jgi:hypothetical protein
MSKSVIHIGANKTGSTTLQRCLFSKSKDLVYIGEDCDDYAVHQDTILSLISDDDIYFKAREAEDLFNRKKEVAGDKTLLFSSEDIMTSHIPALCAKRLSGYLPDAEILLVVRNQLTAVSSMYANHGAYLRNVPRRYWKRFVSFDEWMDHSTNFIKYSLIGSYFYHRILCGFTQYFDRKKVKILFYEDFISNPSDFIKALCAILCIDADEAIQLVSSRRERTRNTMRQWRYHRFCDHFGGRDIIQFIPGATLKRMAKNYIQSGPPAEGFMSDAWRKRVMELYQEDNAKLMNEYGLDLKKHGYPLPG